MTRHRVHSPEAANFVSEKVKFWRRAKELSQTELGRQMGLSFQQIQKYENGTTRITVDALSEISRVLDVPVASFFPRADTPRGGTFNVIEEQLDLLKTEAVILETIESGIRGNLEKLKE